MAGLLKHGTLTKEQADVVRANHRDLKTPMDFKLSDYHFVSHVEGSLRDPTPTMTIDSTFDVEDVSYLVEYLKYWIESVKQR